MDEEKKQDPMEYKICEEIEKILDLRKDPFFELYGIPDERGMYLSDWLKK